MDVRDGNRCNDGLPHEEEAVARAESKPTRGRRLYQKPAFRFERVFETTALSCGKTGTQGQCHGNSSAS